MTMNNTVADISLARSQNISELLSDVGKNLSRSALHEEGILVRMVGLRLEAVGCRAPIGSYCQILTDHNALIDAEVVGFDGDKLLLMAEGSTDGLMPGARVVPMPSSGRIQVGEALIGRVLDGSGKPIDMGAPLPELDSYPLRGNRINPLDREPISEPLDVGVRSINALLTIGRGQRLGLFAGSGVGKTTLLGMMTRNTVADIVVIAMVGERGKEVRDFIETSLTEEGLKKAIVVATPADDSALQRVHGAWLATSIAEYFRAQGKQVLLLMDSLTRFAQAQREIGLAIGEPPVTKGYTPSVFSLLPKLVERAGNGGPNGGSITAIYTVLTEGDDNQDPIADAARAILDGHIVLSRQIADSGLFPAIDIESSISRSMNHIVTADQRQQAIEFKSTLSTYNENRDLISIGAYEAGTDIRVDRAIRLFDDLRDFVAQDYLNKVDMQTSVKDLFVLGEKFRQSLEPVVESALEPVPVIQGDVI